MFGGLFKQRATADQNSAEVEGDRQFVEFQYVLDQELQSVFDRRQRHKRVPPDANAAWPAVDLDGKAGAARRPMYDVFGVALSGGGIRAAAFSLGALQSLNVREQFGLVDYLSTVSGGGYIGSSVSAAMSKPLKAPANQPENAATDGPEDKVAAPFPFSDPARMDDNAALMHLRDYSNYILPRGQASLCEAITIVLRGLATNLVFVFAFLLLFAGLILEAYPAAGELTQGSYLSRLLVFWWTGESAREFLGEHSFALTIRLLVLLVLYLITWALLHSRARKPGDDIYGLPIMVGCYFLVGVLFSAALDFQALVLSLLIWLKQTGFGGAFKIISAAVTPFAAVVSFFSSRLATFLKTSAQNPDTKTQIARVTSVAILWAAAATVPLLLWIFFLWVCASGMPDSGYRFPDAIGASLDYASGHVFGSHARTFLTAGFLLLMLTWAFKPNANSLHQLYRSKLAKAFLFDPGERCPPVEGSPDEDDLVSRSDLKLSELDDPSGGPYHLINAAVNLQGSILANRRGRNANFFLFSPKFIGSTVTGYAATTDVEACDAHIDLGTAMAISGAAVSSDMGSLTALRPLAPTLALLNLRLGYWAPNPFYLQYPELKDSPKFPGYWRRYLSRRLGGYLYSEMFGVLDEKSAKVYVTDGGHIENLGLYELLKRHCKVILVVDGEADPQLTFQTLAACERYARIDLGVRIDLPWEQIAKAGSDANNCVAKGEPIPRKATPEAKGGPHCAMGTIHYPGGEEGLLVYLKASITGDEPDYVIDYKRRNPVFPHESTGDQFFSEEQFEAYRALGFHALDGVLNDTSSVACGLDVLAAAKQKGKQPGEYFKSQLP